MRAHGSLRTNSYEVVRAGVITGKSVGLSPSWPSEQEIQRGKPRGLLPDVPSPSLPAHLSHPSLRRLSVKLKTLPGPSAANRD